MSQVRLPNEIEKGMHCSFEQIISSELIDSFSKLSGDWNPLHNDPEYVSSLGLPARVAHGAIQQALISRVLGMFLPGKFCVIHKVHSQYLQMVFEGETLKVQAEVVRWDASIPSGQIKVTIESVEGKLKSVSFAEVGMVGVASKKTVETVKPQPSVVPSLDSKIVFFGSSSGLAQQLKLLLEQKGRSILGVSRKNSDHDFSFHEVEKESLINWLTEQSPYGVVFFSSLAPKKSVPSKLDLDGLKKNIELHFLPLQFVAQAISEGKLPTLKRIVLFGSTFARHLYPEKGFEEYSYAKMLVSYFAKDLARELIKHGVTINVIAPSEMALGMNSGLSEKTRALISTKNPTGKLVLAEEVAEVISMLLSPDAGALTGQELVVAGGR